MVSTALFTLSSEAQIGKHAVGAQAAESLLS